MEVAYTFRDRSKESKRRTEARLKNNLQSQKSWTFKASTKEHIPENQEDGFEIEENPSLNFKFVNCNVAIHVGKQ